MLLLGWPLVRGRFAGLRFGAAGMWAGIPGGRRGLSSLVGHSRKGGKWEHQKLAEMTWVLQMARVQLNTTFAP